ncbi:regulator of microtubule dynamics protein 2 [Gouania willdenowi]|uniref:regulator of microtubule dynamics protein 2 n=1 Tax=Gouania willdenowi TaxID=441366 RepID=UPI001054F3DD|nr:regulator of microtubule dynamics protein 2-like [Gouania willdenowi]XP_028324469.1 regulator of microtubule dynamics protein 2-like [Gouania willdenowi]
MAHSSSKVLVLGALTGVAGISLAVVCYRGFKSRRRASCPAFNLNCTNVEGPGMTVVDGLGGLQHGQAEVLDRLEALIQCVSELKDEMKALKNALPTLTDQVRVELGGREKTRRVSTLSRTTPTRRKRLAGAVSEGRAEALSSEDAESEGGYITALTDSDEEDDEEKEDEEEEEQSEEELKDGEEPADMLALIDRIDCLHKGSESDKRESLSMLLEQKEKFGQKSPFLWRLIRAYCDVHDISSTMEDKKTLAEAGKTVGEVAVSVNPTCAESHQWYAIMCGIMAEYDTLQNKIKNGYIFKDHLDKAIELKPLDPLSYYLLGRWCYAVAQLSWIERKIATTLFGEPPSATVEDALRNFLKVEEIQPSYSKLNYVFLAKCYRDMGQRENAKRMCEAACSVETVSKDDDEAQKELSDLCPALGLELP